MQIKAKVAALGALGLLAAGVVVGIRGRAVAPSFSSPGTAPASETLDVESGAAGRAVLNRVWFDRMPTSDKEDTTLWLFLAGGIGVQMSGSSYRSTTELFDLERAKNRLELVTLQDDKTTSLTFDIQPCDDKPPFNLCLRFDQPLRGTKVLYGFGREDEAAERLEWFRQLRSRAHAEADSSRATK